MSPAEVIAEFVLEQMVNLPTERRIVLLRALAIESTDAVTQQRCRREAADLELIEKQHAEIMAHIRRKQNPAQN